MLINQFYFNQEIKIHFVWRLDKLKIGENMKLINIRFFSSASDLVLDTIAAQDVPHVNRIGRLPTCLKVDTELEVVTPETDEDSSLQSSIGMETNSPL